MQFWWAQICMGAAIITRQMRPEPINSSFNGSHNLLRKFDTSNRCVLQEVSHLVHHSILGLCKFQIDTPSCWFSLEYADYISFRRGKIPQKKGCLKYDTKLHPIVKLQFLQLHLHCHYSQVHSDLEWWYLLGTHLWIK